jgi:hypothetical protein
VLEGRLLADLVALIELVKEFGASPVLLNYPWDGQPSTISETLREAAEDRGAAFVDMVAPFVAAHETTPHEVLFVPDGHCSSEGYTIMAREISKELRRLERAVS